MNLLQRYLVRQFVPACFATLVFLVFMFELGDLFFNLWKYLTNGVGAQKILTVLYLYLPKCVSYSLPMAVLFSASYTMGTMYAHNELTSVFASGYSLYRLIAPLLVIGFLFSVGMFFFEDRIVIHSVSAKDNLTRVLLHQNESLSNSNIVVRSDSGDTIYTADYYEEKTKQLFSLMVIKRGANKLPTYILQTPVATWSSDHWMPANYTLYSISDLGEITVSSTALPFTITEPPETFMRNITTVDELSAKEAKKYIENLRKSGLPFAEQMSNYYKRFSFPFTIFIVLFFSISLGGRFKKNVILMSFLLSLCVAVLYYVTQMITMLFAKWEYISPFAGAWFPVFVFIAISSVILRYART